MLKVKSWLRLALGGLVAASAILAGHLLRLTFDTGWQAYAFAIGGYLAAAALGWVWTVYNSLVGLRQRVRQASAQVDVQLKRRSDLVPALTEVSRGRLAHETRVQEVIAALRMQTASAGLQGAGAALRAVVEGYPDLKASETMLRLQQSLPETEQRIALARDYFNNIASFYNTRLGIVPDRAVARLAGLERQPLLTASDLERAPLTVSLDS